MKLPLIRRIRPDPSSRSRLATRVTCALITGLLPGLAAAHVKWFVDYNLAEPPRPVFGVLFGHYFMAFFALVIPLMFVIAIVDRALMRRQSSLQRAAEELTERTAQYFPLILRGGVAIFFTAAFVYGCLGESMILTPELHTHAGWVCWLQLVLAILALFSLTAFATGLGIFVLYGYAISQYGLFHMLDYPIFLGVASFLILESLYKGRKRDLAGSIVRVCAGVTLLWASVEKWAFPEWSFLLMTKHPGMALGFNPEFYMVAAGYVEFCAAYLLITGLMSARFSALLLLVLFLIAIMPFGQLDAIGHLVIIVVLLQLALSDNAVGKRLHADGAAMTSAAKHAVAFLATLAVFFVAYYAGYHASYPEDVRAALRESRAPITTVEAHVPGAVEGQVHRGTP